MGLQIRQKLSSPGSIWVGLSVFAIDDLSLIAYWRRQLDAPDGAVIGVPGKAERCGSSSTCVLLDSAKKTRLRQACALQGRRRAGCCPYCPYCP
jgi:hypothetical protein